MSDLSRLIDEIKGSIEEPNGIGFGQLVSFVVEHASQFMEMKNQVGTLIDEIKYLKSQAKN